MLEIAEVTVVPLPLFGHTLVIAYSSEGNCCYGACHLREGVA